MIANARPGHWTDLPPGRLRSAIEAYLRDEPLAAHEIATLRAYLKGWIDRGEWGGSGIAPLRASVGKITSRRDIDHWLADADAENIDPL